MIKIILFAIVIYSFWNPFIGSSIFIGFSTLFNIWVYVAQYLGKVKLNLNTFSDKEKEVIKKYPIFFKYTFAARSTSAIASGIYLLGVILIIFLLLKGMWIYAILMAINTVLAMLIQSKLNPQHFLHEAVEKRKKSEFQNEMIAVDSAIKKIADSYKKD